MKRLILNISFAVQLASVCWVLLYSNAKASQPHVILITIDGFPADYLENENLKMPTLHRLVQQGVRARRMKTIYPTVTGPSHTVLVTGVSAPRHGIRGNAYFDKRHLETGNSVSLDKKKRVTAPTVYDVAKQAGLTTAAVAWPETREVEGIDVNLWNVKTNKDRSRFLQQADAKLIEFLTEEDLSLEKKVEWTQSLSSNVFNVYEIDRLLTQMAVQTIKRYKPNLLLVHLYAVDTIQHRYGRDTKEAYEACEHSDQMLKTILEAAEELDDLTVFVVSDHGFQNYDKHVNINEFLRRENLLTVENGKIVSRHVHFVSHGGGGELYILDEKKRAEIAKDLADKLRNLEGMGEVILPSEYPEIGLLSPEEDPSAPDLVISAAQNYAFSIRPKVLDVVTKASAIRGGTHGYSPNNQAMDAMFVAWGEKIESGKVLESVDIRDVAPTVAACLKLNMPFTEGKTLTGILRQ